MQAVRAARGDVKSGLADARAINAFDIVWLARSAVVFGIGPRALGARVAGKVIVADALALEVGGAVLDAYALPVLACRVRGAGGIE